jgi:tRNA pseudouridine38-40 synthase
MTSEIHFKRLKLTIAYDGRPFCGWQSQAKGGSVQDHLEAAFAKLCNAEGRIVVHGSGRTDAGVHALAQVAHADVPATRFTPAQWVAALNGHLPREVRVMRCQWAPPGFEARFSAKGKIYCYRLWNGPVFPPQEIGRAWHVFMPVDIEILRQCANGLVGTHDFGGFAANRGTPCDDTVRTIHRIDITGRPGKNGGPITLTFEGDGFLYRMVRLLTGSMIRCAQGKASPEWLFGLLETPKSGPRPKSSFAAPAEGLTLVRVLY